MNFSKKLINSGIVSITVVIISSCADLMADSGRRASFEGIKIGECIDSSSLHHFDYERNLQEAASGVVNSMRGILTIGHQANFDGAAASAHRNILWKLFQTKRETFIIAYKLLDDNQQRRVAQRLNEALVDELRE